MTAPGMVLAAVTGFCGSLKDSPGQKMLVPYPQTRGLHTILKSMGRVTRLSEHQMQRLQSALFSCRYSFHLLRRFFQILFFLCTLPSGGNRHSRNVQEVNGICSSPSYCAYLCVLNTKQIMHNLFMLADSKFQAK